MQPADNLSELYCHVNQAYTMTQLAFVVVSQCALDLRSTTQVRLHATVLG
jgi:hypothetical protein